MIRATLIVLSLLVAYAVTTPEETTADDFGCAGAATASTAFHGAATCSGTVAAPAAVVVHRRATLLERLQTRRAARLERRQLRHAGCSAAAVAVPVLVTQPVGCGG